MTAPSGKLDVLAFETYKSGLLPFVTLSHDFLEYDNEDDFVGIDMVPKFLQMGITRAKLYADYMWEEAVPMGQMERAGWGRWWVEWFR